MFMKNPLQGSSFSTSSRMPTLSCSITASGTVYQVAQNCRLSHFCHLTLVHQLIPVGRLVQLVPVLHLFHPLLAHLLVQVHRGGILAWFTRQCLNGWVSRSLTTDSPCCFSSEGEDCDGAQYKKELCSKHWCL